MAEVFNVRLYNDDPYLKFPGAQPFKIKLGSASPTLRVYVYQRTDLFGDALPLELAGLEVIFQLFNSNGLLVASNTATITDLNRAQVEYVFQPFDIKSVGVYYGTFIFKDIDGSTFTLPSRDRLQIVVF